MRLVLVGPPWCGQGHPGGVHRRAPLGAEDLDRRPLPRERRRQGRRSGSRRRSTWTPGELVPDEVTINMVRDRLAEPTPPTASSSTASRARPAGRGAGRHAGRARHQLDAGARAGRRRRRGDPAAVRPAHLPRLRQDLARRVRPPTTRRDLRPLRRRAVPARRRQAGDDPGPARGLRRQTAPLVDFYARRASWWASTPPARWRTSDRGAIDARRRTSAELRGCSAAAQIQLKTAEQIELMRAPAWWWPRRWAACGRGGARGSTGDLDAVAEETIR